MSGSDSRIKLLIGALALLVIIVVAVAVTGGSDGDGEATAARDKPEVSVPEGPAPKQLEIEDLEPGEGPGAEEGDVLTVNYVGVLYDGGTEFDTSWGKQPFEFTLGEGGVIKGWDRGLVGMKAGGRRQLVIPARLAYGEQGSPPTIPANAPLVFVVDLLAIN